MIDLEEDKAARAVLFGLLAKYGAEVAVRTAERWGASNIAPHLAARPEPGLSRVIRGWTTWARSPEEPKYRQGA